MAAAGTNNRSGPHPAPPELWGFAALAALAAAGGVRGPGAVSLAAAVLAAVAGPGLVFWLLRRPSDRPAWVASILLVPAALLTADGNGTAGVLATALPPAVTGAVALRGWGRLSCGAAALVAAGALVHFGSRGAALAAVVGLAAWSVAVAGRPRN
ncbi:MAG: hypothetical protein AAGF23_16610, partial [Acidobacteriota bacterium]